MARANNLVQVGYGQYTGKNIQEDAKTLVGNGPMEVGPYMHVFCEGLYFNSG